MESSNTELSLPNGYKQWFGTRWVGKGFEYMYIYLPGLLKVVPLSFYICNPSKMLPFESSNLH